ncbi:MAG: HIT family protein [Candidatus Aenigmarchaeota archaeon]|nr:HIT family protein [Candidatus Aenigmarchaeota archaeon]
MDCAFCRIARGDLPAAKVWESADFLAILDLFPTTEGMTVLMTKAHEDSYVFRLPESRYLAFLAAARTVGTLLERALQVPRVILLAEGLEVPHAHLKLYPLPAGRPFVAGGGKKADPAALQDLAGRIRAAQEQKRPPV